MGADELKTEKIKDRVSTKVERLFRYIKQVSGLEWIRYRDIANNTNRLYVLAMFSYLLMGKSIHRCSASTPEFRHNGEKRAKKDQLKVVNTPG